MNDLVTWIAAEAEKPGFVEPYREGRTCSKERPAQGITVHNFPGERSLTIKDTKVHEGKPERGLLDARAETLFTTEGTEAHRGNLENVELSYEEERARRIYRGRTVAMLRRYMTYSLETGRMPSLLGREIFRAKVTSYTVTTFEDRVIFVHDMEKCLDRLDEFSREVLARVVLQEYEHEEAARLLGCTRMTVHRRLLEALDTLTEILISVELLRPLSANEEKSCQEGEKSNFFLSDCEEGK